jgi:outer membrane murein-binding lipoprotein Lpp
MGLCGQTFTTRLKYTHPFQRICLYKTKEYIMRNVLKTFGATAFAGLLLAGCASVAHIEKDESVDLANYRNFAWIDTKESKDDSVNSKVSDLAERKLKDAVNAELIKVGWKESKKPDVFLTYDVAVEKGLKEQDNPVYSRSQTRYFFNPYTRRWVPVYYPSQLLGYDREEHQIREGTITISLIDAKTDKTVWQGWTTDEVASRNLTSKEIQASIKSIFRKFDVAKN